MNVIQIVCDTLRRDHLGAYGNPWIRTPSLDRLAAQGIVFENAWAGSFPTLPHRTDVFTGRYAFRQYAWQGLPAEETPIAAILSAAGVKTQFILDNPHLMSFGHGFDRGFGGSEWIRGQEDELYRTYPRRPPSPRPRRKWRNPEGGYLQYLRNIHRRRGEGDYFPARTSAAAADWLRENARDGDFFLHVDFFDPHEPFDPPPGYAERYGIDRRAPRITYPRYGLSDPFRPGELRNVRALYAGEVTLVDKYVGRLVDAVDRLGLAGSTAVFLTADHGFCLGEHGLVGKALVDKAWIASRSRYVVRAMEGMPFYQELARVPLLVRLPGAKAGRTGALVQPVDLMPTALEILGLLRTPAGRAAGPGRPGPVPSVLTARGRKAARELGFDPRTLHGRSLVPLLRGRAKAHRRLAATSQPLQHHDPLRARAAITDGEFVLHYCGRYDGGERRTHWAAATRRSAGFRGGVEPFLVHLPSDPTEDRNLLDPGTCLPPGTTRDGVWARARTLHAQYVEMLEEIGTPPQHLRGRRWFPKG